MKFDDFINQVIMFPSASKLRNENGELFDRYKVTGMEDE